MAAGAGAARPRIAGVAGAARPRFAGGAGAARTRFAGGAGAARPRFANPQLGGGPPSIFSNFSGNVNQIPWQIPIQGGGMA